MRQIIYILLFAFTTHLCLAQLSGCYTHLEPIKTNQHDQHFLKLKKGNSNLRIEVSDTIPIQIHVVVGKNGSMVNSDSINSYLSKLNKAFLPVKLQFATCNSTHYIYQSKYDSVGISGELSLNALYNSPYTIDVFFVNYIDGAAGIYSNLGGGDGIIIMRNNAPIQAFIHEFGHYFGLYHTHETSFGKELADGSNCSTAGDRLCDTPADPNLSKFIWTDCTYKGSVKDDNSQLYTPDPSNYMSYSPDKCRDHFTKEQYDLIRLVYDYSYVYLFHWACSKQPDLVTSIDKNLTQLPKGKTNTVKIIVSNISSAAFSASNVKYRLKLMDALKNETVLTEGIFPYTIAPLSSDTLSLAVFVPSSLNDGVYTLSSEIDYDNKIAEITDTNNTGKQRVSVSLTGQAICELSITSTGAEYTYAGYDYEITSVLNNTGRFDSNGEFLKTYLSKDTELTPDDDLLDVISYKILSDQEIIDKKKVVLPYSVGKTFYIIRILDQENNNLEKNKSNNISITKVTLINAPSRLKKTDYKLDNFSFTNTNLGEAERSQHVQLIGDIINSGDTTGYIVPVATYYSKDNVWDTSDLLIYQSDERVYNSIKIQINMAADIPFDAPLGNAYLILVADYKNQLLEKDETNNTLSIPIKVVEDTHAKIDFTKLTLDSYNIPKNTSMKVNGTVQNIGLSSTKTIFLEFYYTTEIDFYYYNRIGMQLGYSYDTSPIASNSSRDFYFVSKNDLNAGTYYLTTCANYSTLGKQYSRVNCYTLPNKITIGDPTRIEENNNLEYNNVKVNPNPATGFLSISTSKNILSAELYTIGGIKLKELTIENGSGDKFSIEGISAGTYFLKIVTDDSIVVKKVMIR